MWTLLGILTGVTTGSEAVGGKSKMKDWKILILLLAVSTIIQFCVMSHLLSKVDFLQEQVYKIGNWHCRLEEQYYADHLKGCGNDA